MGSIQSCINALEKVKRKKPLIHNITNYVTVNDCANAILAIGGSPVMADEDAEVEQMTSLASCLVINMGTPNERTVAAMVKAGRKANRIGVPVVFDPVGVGATEYRNLTAGKILAEVQVAVIRGNMSEIKYLSGLTVQTKGVDSIAEETGAAEAAKSFAAKMKCVVAATGKIDIVTDGKRVGLIANGHLLLTGVTGTGCMSSALTGAYCGAEEDYFIAAMAGIMTMGLAGELAQRSLRAGEGAGTFRIRIIDKIAALNEELIRKEGRISFE